MTLLSPPDPYWGKEAAMEIALWHENVPGLVQIHHIGSTSVPGLPAKPILDLMPVFADTTGQNEARGAVECMGYEWLAEYGLPGRRYARRTSTSADRLRVHAHCYAVGHPDTERYLAFRDALRTNAALRAAYTSVKASCAARHPEGGDAYQSCKSNWINKAEAIALERLT